MSHPRMDSFSEFWPYYLRQHEHRATRWIHGLGLVAAAVLVVAAVVARSWSLVLIAPVVAYGMAWLSHFFIEKNCPATFHHPFWSFLGDFKMFGLMLLCRMPDLQTRQESSVRQTPTV